MKVLLRPVDRVLIAIAVIGVGANAAAVYFSCQHSDWLPVFNLVGSIGLLACALLTLRAAFLRASRMREDGPEDSTRKR